MSDEQTTLAELRRLMAEFVREREWEKYHAPKNLAMSLAIEAAELMEHFQWLTVEESREMVGRPEAMAPVAEELADVMCYLLAFSNATGIDISSAVRAKMVRNAEKYPADQFRGRYG